MQSGFNFINNHSFHHLLGRLYQTKEYKGKKKKLIPELISDVGGE